MLASFAFFKNRGSELLPILLIASLAFSFLIAVHRNTMRFHQVKLFNTISFSPWISLVCEELAGKQLILSPRADNFLQIKTPSALVTWEKLNKGPAYSQSCSFHSSGAPHRAARFSRVRRKHAASKGTIKHCSHLTPSPFRLSHK